MYHVFGTIHHHHPHVLHHGPHHGVHNVSNDITILHVGFMYVYSCSRKHLFIFDYSHCYSSPSPPSPCTWSWCPPWSTWWTITFSNVGFMYVEQVSRKCLITLDYSYLYCHHESPSSWCPPSVHHHVSTMEYVVNNNFIKCRVHVCLTSQQEMPNHNRLFIFVLPLWIHHVSTMVSVHHGVHVRDNIKFLKCRVHICLKIQQEKPIHTRWFILILLHITTITMYTTKVSPNAYMVV